MIESISEYMWQIWAVVAVICLILELTSGDFFIACFAVGAVASSIVAACGLGFYWQLFFFALFSLVALFWVRPMAKRYLHREDKVRLSNADALVGRQGRVVEPIKKGGYGRVKIDGDVWKAHSSDGEPINEDTAVKVVGRESTIIEVKTL